MGTFCNDVHSDVSTLWLVSSSPPIKICLDSLKCLHLPFMCASMKLLDDIIWEDGRKTPSLYIEEVKSIHNLLWPASLFEFDLIHRRGGRPWPFFDGIYPRCRNRHDNLFCFITPWHDIDNYVISSRLVLNAKIKPHWLYSQRNCE